MQLKPGEFAALALFFHLVSFSTGVGFILIAEINTDE